MQIEKNHPNNTRIEQAFFRRNDCLVQYEKAKQALVDAEYRIALECCPFYLGQRLWYDQDVRTRVYVSQIDFIRTSPYFEFYVTDEYGRNRRRAHLRYLSGIQNTFVEPLEQYTERLTNLIQASKVRLKPKGCSFNLDYIIAITVEKPKTNALEELSKRRQDWFGNIFALDNHSK